MFTPTSIKKELLNYRIKQTDSKHSLEECKHNWLEWTSRFTGIHNYKKWAITHGVHDAILNQVAYRSKTVSKFYSFRDDYKFYLEFLYPYKSETITWEQIDKIEKNSYILVSVPNTRGGVPEYWYDLLDHCKKTKSQIFFDGAYYGTSEETIDVNHEAIDCVAFSLSKNFGLRNIRSGVIFGNDLAWTLTIPMAKDYYDYYSVNIANLILPKFDPLYITRHAKKIQRKIYGINSYPIWFLVKDKEFNDLRIPKWVNNELQNEVQEAIDDN